jgi:hypothetical protein
MAEDKANSSLPRTPPASIGFVDFQQAASAITAGFGASAKPLADAHGSDRSHGLFPADLEMPSIAGIEL